MVLLGGDRRNRSDTRRVRHGQSSEELNAGNGRLHDNDLAQSRAESRVEESDELQVWLIETWCR